MAEIKSKRNRFFMVVKRFDFFVGDRGIEALFNQCFLVSIPDQGAAVFTKLILDVFLFFVEIAFRLMQDHLLANPIVDVIFYDG